MLAIRACDIEIVAQQGEVVASVRLGVNWFAGPNASDKLALDMNDVPFDIEDVRCASAARVVQVGNIIHFERRAELATWDGAVIEYGIRIGELDSSGASSIVAPLFLPTALPQLVGLATSRVLPPLRVVVDELVRGVSLARVWRTPWEPHGGVDLVACAVLPELSATDETGQLWVSRSTELLAGEEEWIQAFLLRGRELFGMLPVQRICMVTASEVRHLLVDGAGVILDSLGRAPEGVGTKPRFLSQLALAVGSQWFGAGVRVAGPDRAVLTYGIQGGIMLALLQQERAVYDLIRAEVKQQLRSGRRIIKSRQVSFAARVAALAEIIGELLSTPAGQAQFRYFLRGVWASQVTQEAVIDSLQGSGIEKLRWGRTREA